MKRYLVSIEASSEEELNEHLKQSFESDTPHRWEVLGPCVGEREQHRAIKQREELRVAIVNVAPYVVATISPGNRIDADRLLPHKWKDWCLVHRGRADSSIRQLESLLKLVAASLRASRGS